MTSLQINETARTAIKAAQAASKAANPTVKRQKSGLKLKNQA